MMAMTIEGTATCAYCGLVGAQLQAYETEHHEPVWLHTHCFDAWLRDVRERKKKGGDSLRDRIERAN